MTRAQHYWLEVILRRINTAQRLGRGSAFWTLKKVREAIEHYLAGDPEY